MMKKVVGILLLFSFTLVGCSNKDSTEIKTNNSNLEMNSKKEAKFSDLEKDANNLIEIYSSTLFAMLNNDHEELDETKNKLKSELLKSYDNLNSYKSSELTQDFNDLYSSLLDYTEYLEKLNSDDNSSNEIGKKIAVICNKYNDGELFEAAEKLNKEIAQMQKGNVETHGDYTELKTKFLKVEVDLALMVDNLKNSNQIEYRTKMTDLIVSLSELEDEAQNLSNSELRNDIIAVINSIFEFNKKSSENEPVDEETYNELNKQLLSISERIN